MFNRDPINTNNYGRNIMKKVGVIPFKLKLLSNKFTDESKTRIHSCIPWLVMQSKLCNRVPCITDNCKCKTIGSIVCNHIYKGE